MRTRTTRCEPRRSRGHRGVASALVRVLVACAGALSPALGVTQAHTAPIAPLPAASRVLNTGSHHGPLRRLALNVAGSAAVTASDDKTAIVWQLDGLRPRHVLRVPVGGGEIGRLYGAAWDPTSSLVALAGTSAGASGGIHRIFVF